ncbi:MAG: class IV adenylate cyclase [Ignavibacteriaceae bacterium]|nr:class IV adenylate cyclase [Ignavibacteriaceae bacterium]
MPVNLEIKVKVKNFDSILSSLKKLKAKKVGVLHQKDVYFSSAKGLLKLRKEGKSQQLIRYQRNEKGKNRWSDFEILELHQAHAESFLRNLLSCEVVVEKERVLYLYDDTRIHLDKVKKLGNFIELETKVVSTKKDAQQRFRFLVNALQLNPKDELRLSYHDLLLQAVKK